MPGSGLASTSFAGSSGLVFDLRGFLEVELSPLVSLGFRGVCLAGVDSTSSPLGSSAAADARAFFGETREGSGGGDSSLLADRARLTEVEPVDWRGAIAADLGPIRERE